MSMYGVNAGVPKTLVRHIVQYVADSTESDTLRSVLRIFWTRRSARNCCPRRRMAASASRRKSWVGPYERCTTSTCTIVLRFGFGPAKIYRLARAAFAGRYENRILLYWLRNFYRRFFAQQFKRSCLPDGPKVGSVTLSPRADWRMPSDASNALWLKELERLAE